ncbi:MULTISPECIES: bifunctional diguanylate cyclase/phosphodiesterase [Bacillaceae]|uniref:bifunctional diguanylate cyclase/phosphodiesterase n=1 Tax=Bacillaceae TaxID=186817 RepID=UPI002963F0E5|nr:EAL domain-containing protein [Bacillus infantis]MDW2879128.1 EAL domain-containing protein [Bacillus infantis]
MFTVRDSENIYILQGHYSVPIVLLSIIIACCASYTALSMNQRMQQPSFFQQRFWLLLSSIAMGLGIWSMHFIGMSAFMLPMPMKYDLTLTIVSVFPAFLASYLAFYISNRKNSTHWPSAISGAIMGMGISAMHYFGMAAMKMEAEYSYKPGLFAASIAIAIVVSYVALYIFSVLQKYMGRFLVKAATALIMGLAITSMHYTGMAAVVFYTDAPLGHALHEMHSMDMRLLIGVITAGILILLAISGLTSLLDRYVEYRLSYFDPLTKLPNQRQFEQDLKNGGKGCLAIIHIHDLEKWNSGFGYSFGDEIIQSVHGGIKGLLPLEMKAYRIEGNRFAMFASGEHEYEKLKAALHRIMAVFTQPLIIGKQRLVIDMVCAVSVASDKQPHKELFSSTMAVLLHSTTRYKHEVIEYNPAVHTYSFEKELAKDITLAMENDDLFLVYQPKISSSTWEVSGMEALLRWNHPRHGMISPGVFIPILEESGKLFKVTDWVIEKVCLQLSHWRKDGAALHQISINIPGPYLTSAKLLNVLIDSLEKYDISSHLLELEITETSVIHDIENAIQAVAQFREMGLSVALDDFGTGVSSLSYLKRIPISTIKIDKSFVDGVPMSEKDSAILRAIISLSCSLNLKVVIEGAEYQDQIDFIASLSESPHVQGYYFSRPLKEEELQDWIQNRHEEALV